MTARMDSLERRHLLDGNVNVIRADGVTRLVAEAGDSIDVRIERADERSVRIVGLGTTTIDGATSRRVRLGSDRLVMDFTRANGVATQIDGVHIARGVTWTSTGGQLLVTGSTLGAINVGDVGNAKFSSVTLSDTTVAGDVRLRFQSGETELAVRSGTVGGKLLINGGERGGTAAVTVENSLVRGEAKLATGAGRDSITLTSSRFRKSVGISSGAGNDTLLFDRSTFAGKLAVNDGAGRDAIQTRLAYDFSTSDGGGRRASRTTPATSSKTRSAPGATCPPARAARGGRSVRRTGPTTSRCT